MRKIIAISLVLVLMFVLSGCGTSGTSRVSDIDANLKKINSEYFDVEVIEDLGGGSFVVVDKNTNVLYLFVKGYQASAMTPIYNSDRTVMLYQDGTPKNDEVR